MVDAPSPVGTSNPVVKGATGSLKNVPKGVWVFAIGAGVLGAYFLSRKSKASTTTPDGTNTTAPSVFTYTGTGGGGPDTTTPTTTTQGYQTNEAWAQAAKNWLIAQGSDAKEASDAVDLYINGQALNTKQNAMISNVIRGIGSPPQSLPPVTGTPSTGTGTTNQTDVWGTTPRQNPASLVGTYYTVQNGDTLVSIAKAAFGLSATDYSSMVYASDEIVNNNHDVITDVTHLTPGTKLYIPVLSSEMFPGFGQYVPQFGYTAAPGAAKSTGEWQIDTGLVPQSANISRSSAKRTS